MDSKRFGQNGSLLNSKIDGDAQRTERFAPLGYIGIKFDTSQGEGAEETSTPNVRDTLAPEVGVLCSVQGEEIPIYKVTLELHVDPEGLRVLQQSNEDLCIDDEPRPCGEGKWAQNGRIVDTSALQALLDAAEPYCTVWNSRPRQARPQASLKAVRGGRS